MCDRVRLCWVTDILKLSKFFLHVGTILINLEFKKRKDLNLEFEKKILI